MSTENNQPQAALNVTELMQQEEMMQIAAGDQLRRLAAIIPYLAERNQVAQLYMKGGSRASLEECANIVKHCNKNISSILGLL